MGRAIGECPDCGLNEDGGTLLAGDSRVDSNEFYREKWVCTCSKTWEEVYSWLPEASGGRYKEEDT